MVGASDDALEREADAAAEVALRSDRPAGDAGPARPAPGQLIDRALLSAPATGAGAAFDAGDRFRDGLRGARGEASPLPPALRDDMQHRFDADFSAVRVHVGPRSDALSRSIAARAFTHGSDVYFARGQFAPGTASGRRLVAHELAHVVQHTRVPARRRDAAPAVQRKIGFEIETRIPIAEQFTAEDGQVQLRDVGHDEFYATLPDGSKLMVDHSEKKGDRSKNPPELFAQLPIIEFASVPVDEKLSPSKFRAQFAAPWLRELKRILDAGNPGSLRDVHAVIDYATTKADVAIVTDLPGHPRNESVALQSTIGLRLDRLPGLMGQLETWNVKQGTQKTGAGDLGIRYAAEAGAREATDRILDALEALDRQERPRAPGRVPSYDVKDLRGFVMLVSSYLQAERAAGGRYYRKNRVPLFAKTGLHNVAAMMATKSKYADLMLQQSTDSTFHVLAGGRAWLRSQLLTENGWTADGILAAGTPGSADPSRRHDLSAGAWIDTLLRRQRDDYFYRSKNPWSVEVAAEEKSGHAVAVTEMRHLSEIPKAQPHGLTLRDPKPIEDYVVALFTWYRSKLA